MARSEMVSSGGADARRWSRDGDEPGGAAPSDATTWALPAGHGDLDGRGVRAPRPRGSSVADGPAIRGRLIGARDDAESLRDLLHTATRREDPSPSANATIESICSLWDANQHYFEQLAADVDPDFYRAWKARSAAARAGTLGDGQRGAGSALGLTAQAHSAGSGSSSARRRAAPGSAVAATATDAERCEVLGRPLHVEEAIRRVAAQLRRRGRPARPSTRRSAGGTSTRPANRPPMRDAVERRRPARRRPTPRRCAPTPARAGARRRPGSRGVIQPPGRSGSAHASTTACERGVDPHLVASAGAPERAAHREAVEREDPPRVGRPPRHRPARASGIGKMPWR